MKTAIPNMDRHNMCIVYHWILQVPLISYIIETCSCLVTVYTSCNCCKAIWESNDFNWVCLHIINETNNEIIAVTNRKTYTMLLLKKGIYVANSKSLILCHFQK